MVGAEVVDVEDELLREILGRSPDDPANTRIDKTVLEHRSVRLFFHPETTITAIFI